MTRIPSVLAVRELFEDLLGRGVTAAVSPDPVVPSAKAPCCISVYVTERLETRALVVADLELAARTGAALGLVPKGGADAALEDRELPKNLLENFSEVTNIFASLFNLPDQPHLKLYRVISPGEAPPDDVIALLRGLSSREDLRLDIDGYGTGRLGVVLPPGVYAA